jgi:tetratricopeptide (TPR) repeat protein
VINRCALHNFQFPSIISFISLFCLISTLVYAQDLEGSTGVVVKPDNPTTKRQSQPKRSSKSIKTTATASRKDIAEQLEEALQEGNRARDANPPLYKEAESAYQLASSLDPKDHRAYAGLGNLYFDQQRYREAELNYRRAIELNPKDSLSHLYLSYTYNRLEQYKDAERIARQSIAIEAKDYRSYDSLGWSLYKQQKLKESESAYMQAIGLSPGNRDLYITLGRILMEQREYKQALPIVQKTVELAKENSAKANSYYAYGLVLHKLGRLDQAAEQYIKSIQTVGLIRKVLVQPRPCSKLAIIYFTKENMLKAREQWSIAVKLGSTYELDHIGLLIMDKNIDEARRRLEAYTKSNREDEDGWLLLGDVYRFRGDQLSADSAYQQAARLAPDYARLPRPTPNRRTLIKDRSVAEGTASPNINRPRLPLRRNRTRDLQ